MQDVLPTGDASVNGCLRLPVDAAPARSGTNQIDQRKLLR